VICKIHGCTEEATTTATVQMAPPDAFTVYAPEIGRQVIDICTKHADWLGHIGPAHFSLVNEPVTVKPERSQPDLSPPLVEPE
jgi:hypothetical protein